MDKGITVNAIYILIPFLYNETTKLIQLSTETFEHAVKTAASFFPLLIIFLIIALLLIGIFN